MTAATVGFGPAAGVAAARPAPVATLVVASATALQLVDPTTGAVVRTVPLPAPDELALDASEPDSQMAVAPDGKTAYVTVQPAPGIGVRPAPPEILAVPLDGGAPAVVATDAVAPAVNRAGDRLAYLQDSAPVPRSGPVAPRPSETVVILNLATRARRALDLRDAYAEANGPVAVNGLSWSPSGSTLAVAVVEFADVYGSYDTVDLLDPAAPVSQGNPELLRVRGSAPIPPAANPTRFVPGFQSATYRTDGDLAVISAEPAKAGACSAAAGACAALTFQVLSIEPASERAQVTFAPGPEAPGWFAVDQLAFGAHGALYLLGRSVCPLCRSPLGASAERLFAVRHGVAVQLGHGVGFRAVAWDAGAG